MYLTNPGVWTDLVGSPSDQSKPPFKECSVSKWEPVIGDTHWRGATDYGAAVPPDLHVVGAHRNWILEIPQC